MKKPAPAVIRKRRCAVYTRKSSEEGLEMEFNSLDAQREACQAYIASQRSEGWVEHADRYDDGGFSGGTLERPALRRLLADIEEGRIDVVVVYKIDRLSRSLMDFARLVEVLDRNNVPRIAVSQPKRKSARKRPRPAKRTRCSGKCSRRPARNRSRRTCSCRCP